jgi:hypothetical protein
MSTRRKSAKTREFYATKTLEKAIMENSLECSDVRMSFHNNAFAMIGTGKAQAQRTRQSKPLKAKDFFYFVPSDKPRHGKGVSFKVLVDAGLYS